MVVTVPRLRVGHSKHTNGSEIFQLISKEKYGSDRSNGKGKCLTDNIAQAAQLGKVDSKGKP